MANFLKYYLSKAALPYWAILAIDCFAVVLSGFIAFSLHHGIPVTLQMLTPLSATVGICLVCYAFAFRIFHTYNGIIRYSSFTDLLRVAGAVILAMAIISLITLLVPQSDWFLHLSWIDIVLMGLLVIAFMWGFRVCVKTVFETVTKRPDTNRVWILGVQSGAYPSRRAYDRRLTLPTLSTVL